jgi:hypothetical protein
MWSRTAKAKVVSGAPVDSVGAEAPITTASEDLLRRERFARRISEILTAGPVPQGRVFAIRSAWGNGKSSTKNLIIEQIGRRDGNALWLDFNPWQWGDDDAIAAALFSQMASKLKSDYSPEALQRARLLRQYGGILAGAASPLKGFSDDKSGLAVWGPPLFLFLAGLGVQLPGIPHNTLIAIALFASAAAMIVGNVLKFIGRDRSKEPLDDVRADLERHLKRLPGPLIVFVDDIDRLEKEQIRRLIRQVKVNANLPGIVFLLLFQTSIVTKALDEIADGAGDEYLEKIVQANFDLPEVPPEKIFSLFVEQLEPLLADLATPENGFGEVRWGNMLLGGLRPYVRNLRDSRRLLSSIAVHLPMHRGDRAFEVNIIDFVALEAIRVFDPKLFAVLASSKALLLQIGRIDPVESAKRDKPEIEALLQLASIARREAATALVRELFPTIEWALGGSHYDNGWCADWTASKRVCVPTMFSRYFELQIPEGTVSESRLAAFYEEARSEEGLKGDIEAMDADGLLPALVSRLDQTVQQVPLSHIYSLLPGLFDIGERLKAASDTPFNEPYISTWRTAVWYLRRVEDPAERSRILHSAMTRSEGLSVPALMISLDLDARTKPDAKHEPLFDDIGLESLKEAWVAKVRALAAKDDLLLDQSDLVSLLYRWRDFEDSFAGPKGWVNAVVAQPGRLERLIWAFMNVGQMQAMGDQVAVRTERFEKTPIVDFFDLDSLAERVAKLDKDGLSADHRRAVELLADHVEKWRTAPAEGPTSDPSGKPGDD